MHGSRRSIQCVARTLPHWQGNKYRAALEEEFKHAVASGNVTMPKNEKQIPIRGGEYVGLAQILLKKDFQAKAQGAFRVVPWPPL